MKYRHYCFKKNKNCYLTLRREKKKNLFSTNVTTVHNANIKHILKKEKENLNNNTKTSSLLCVSWLHRVSLVQLVCCNLIQYHE